MTIASEQAAIEMLAEFLAAHALLLLGIGLVLSALAILAIVASVRWLSAVLDHLRRMLSRHPSLTAIITGLSVPPRARTVAAGVLVYLIVGLVSAAAIAVFVAVAEEVVGGGEMAVFDVAFGQALRRAGSPEWEEFFARVSRLGTPDVVFGATVAGAVALMVRGQLAAASVWLASQAGTAALVIVTEGAVCADPPGLHGFSGGDKLELSERTRDGYAGACRRRMQCAPAVRQVLDCGSNSRHALRDLDAPHGVQSSLSGCALRERCCRRSLRRTCLGVYLRGCPPRSSKATSDR